MTLISDEIQQLQLRILELEKQQKEKDENYKKISNYNFKIINDLLNKNKMVIKNESVIDKIISDKK
jgi:hypothetical protein